MGEITAVISGLDLPEKVKADAVAVDDHQIHINLGNGSSTW